MKNIVLVHGAWADGSSWAKVIPLLQAKGFNVVSVQNPVTSLADDVLFTHRAIAAIDGPILLVGHSWGGQVITEAGNDPKVVGLIYVCAPALDAGQALGEMLKPYPQAPLNAELKPVAEGFVAITQKGFIEDFAQDLPSAEINALWAVQGSASLNIFTDKPTVAAWKTRPSWYVIGANDRAFPPAFHRDRAKAINATAIEIKSSHVPMLSHPQKIAEIIAEAASKASSSKVGMR